ncbi:MAG: hypothetical protein Q9222_006765, partial [Ikaeria aurantiellina]
MILFTTDPTSGKITFDVNNKDRAMLLKAHKDINYILPKLVDLKVLLRRRHDSLFPTLGPGGKTADSAQLKAVIEALGLLEDEWLNLESKMLDLRRNLCNVLKTIEVRLD